MTLEEPEPADGWNNYDMYLANNLKTPESFKSKQRSGTVELTFDVDNNGVPYNIAVKKSLCDSCDKEAIRLVKEGPRWKRKLKKGGKATVTVSF
jgi:TonB family protein